MKKFIITESEKKHIMELYEQKESGDRVAFGCESQSTFTCPPNTTKGEGSGYDPMRSAKLDAERNWLKSQGNSSSVTVGNETTTTTSGSIPPGVEVVKYMECKGKVIACISVPKKRKK